MLSQDKKIRSERTAIYFDCICGSISSIITLIGIFVMTEQERILHPINFTVGLIFWFGYLGFSIFLIILGIYTYYRAKNYDSDAISKKKIRAPIV